MKTKLLVLFVGLYLTFTAQIPSYVPQQGLQGYWPFTGNANDLSPNAYNGSLQNSPQLTTDRFNNAASAYDFNGSSYILTNYSGVLGSAPRAMAFWARTSNTGVMSAVAWGGNNKGTRFNGMFNYGQPGVTIDGADGAITYNSSGNSFDGQWHHYIFQFSVPQLDQVEVYMDNALLTQTLFVYKGTNSLNTFQSFNVLFGRIFNSTPIPFIGSLDEIGIWDRTLTPCERSQLFMSTLNPNGGTLTATASKLVICKSEVVSLTASGATSYTWSGLGSSPVVTVQPGVTTTYTLTGLWGPNSCAAQALVTITAMDCTSLEKENMEILTVWPTPACEELLIRGVRDGTSVTFFDIGGRLCKRLTVTNSKLDIRCLEPGIYFLWISDGETILRKKIIKE